MSHPILYDKHTTQFTHLGIGVLKDAISCMVTEERNGMFELEMTYPNEGILADKLEIDYLIKADAGHANLSKEQLFRIERIDKSIDGRINVYAKHISYLAQSLALEPNVDMSNLTASEALKRWRMAIVENHPFTTSSNITTRHSTHLTIQNCQNARLALGGTSHSILDIWGGEYVFDNYRIDLRAERGGRANTLIAYGRNLTDLDQEENISNTFTSVYPYAVFRNDQDEEEIITIPGFIVDAETAGAFAHRRVLPVDFSREFERGVRPTETALKQLAQAYIVQHEIGIPRVSIALKFVDLTKSLNQEGLVYEQLNLCDTVPVYFEKLGIRTHAKVVRIKWDVLLDQYESIEVGDTKKTLGDTIREIERDVNNANNNSNYALTSANGRNTVFYGQFENPPGPPANRVGDLWYRPNGEETELWMWNGAAWEFVMSTAPDERLREEIEREMKRVQEELDRLNDTLENEVRPDLENNAEVLKELNRELENLNQELADLEQQLKENKQEINSINKIELPALREELDHLNQETLPHMQDDLDQLNQQVIPHLNKELGSLNQELLNLDEIVSENKQVLHTLNTETLPGVLNELRTLDLSDLIKLRRELDELNNNLLPSINIDLEKVNRELSNLDQRMINNQEGLNTLNSVTLPVLRTELKQLAGDLTELDKRMTTNENEINTLNTQTLPTLRQDIVQLNDVTLPNVQNDLKHLETELSGLTDLTDEWRYLDSVQIDGGSIRSNTVRTNHMAANSINGDRIATNTLNANRITANTITGDRIISNAIGANHITSNAVTAEKIASGAVTTEKMTASSINGDRIATNTLNANRITANTITGDRIVSNAIGANHITSNAVTAEKIASGAVTTEKMTASSINGDRIATNTLNANRITAGSITTDRMTVNSIDGDRIRANTLNADRIRANSITGDQIAANAIQATHLTIGDFTNLAQVNEFDPSSLINGSIVTITNRWIQGGHATNESHHQVDFLRSNTPTFRVGDQFLVRFTGFREGGNITGVRFIIRYSYNDGGSILDAASTTVNLNTTATDHTLNLTIVNPPDPNRQLQQVRFFFESNGRVNGFFRFRNVGIFRRNNGQMIIDGAIVTNHMTTNSINGDRITTNTLNTNRITAGSITTDRMTVNSVDGDRIRANTLNADRITAGSITTDRMTTNSINGDRIATNTLNANRITAGSITTDRMTANTINGDRIATNTLNANRITAGSITTDRMMANSINGDRIAANTFNGDRIIANTIHGDRIRANTIHGDRIIANTITGNQISANAITSGHIATNAITANMITTGTLNAAHVNIINMNANNITSGTLNAARIAAGSITASHMTLTDHTNLVQVNPLIPSTLQLNGSNQTRTVGAIPDIRSTTSSWAGLTLAVFRDRTAALNGLEYQLSGEFRSSIAQNLHLIFRVHYTTGDHTQTTVPLTGGAFGVNAFSHRTTNIRLANFDTTRVFDRLVVQVEGGAATSRIDMRNVRLIRRQGAELLVDGAIRAHHIAAGTITANMITAGTMSAARIGTGTLTVDYRSEDSNANTFTRITGGRIEMQQAAGYRARYSVGGLTLSALNNNSTINTGRLRLHLHTSGLYYIHGNRSADEPLQTSLDGGHVANYLNVNRDAAGNRYAMRLFGHLTMVGHAGPGPQILSSGGGDIVTTANGRFRSPAALVITSSRELKEDIQPVLNPITLNRIRSERIGLDVLNNLKVVTYRLKRLEIDPSTGDKVSYNGVDEMERHIGVIAEDSPDIAFSRSDETVPSIDTGKVMWHTVLAIQQLSQQVIELEKKINKKENETNGK